MQTPLIDKNAPDHLYRQVSDSLRAKICSGEYAPGALLPTETALCERYNVSRFPMRQAMAILVEEGYLVRTRGKGTFVNAQEHWEPQNVQCREQGRSLALLLAGRGDDFALDILNGFERYASEHGYVMMLAFTRSPQLELECLQRMQRCGADGVVIFPADGSLIDEAALNGLVEAGVYVSFLDRHPGLDHIDYVGSDNNGGGYSAARHMHLRGYASAVFVSDALRSGVSSVGERFTGFRRGLQQYGMDLLNDRLPTGGDDFTLEGFRAALPFYMERRPFAIFAENFFMAKRAARVLQENGLSLGDDIGMICFDDLPESRYVYPQMTTVAQNGILLGETAAALAIDKIESASRQSVRHILPTQLIVRRSCGEDRMPR